ncbi:MAG: hypothetical protein KME16_00120 [Scytolyngbya sp. HA4215-MV1]|nr:hypothetical protein [Scytolyngbya sp. HA4215-MV1]
MSSIHGELIVILLTHDGRFQAQRPVTLQTAAAVFQEIPPGRYTIIARHPDLSPTEARCDAVLSEKTIFGVRFNYNEPERQLSTIETEVNELP